jgi:Tol biopolymer transport system component
MKLRYKALLGCTILLLITFVAPFSYLPNPLGLYYLINGGYRYNPYSIFVNRFATRYSDPTESISTKLNKLLGATGLDPLDATYPLVAYTIEEITTRPKGIHGVTAKVALRYADGTLRSYIIPIYKEGRHFQAPIRWVSPNLDRLLAPHQQLPHLPILNNQAPLKITQLERLSASNGTHELTNHAVQPGNEILWSPTGQQFLVQMRSVESPDVPSLWLVARDGSPIQKIVDNVVHYAWSSDGHHIVYLQFTGWADVVNAQHSIVDVDLSRGTERRLGDTDRDHISIVNQAVYFLHHEVLWRVSLETQSRERVGILPSSGAAPGVAGPIVVSPDAQRIAYRCGSDLCLSDVSGSNAISFPLKYAPPATPETPPATTSPGPLPTASSQQGTPAQLDSLEVAWSSDGAYLAVAAGSYERGPETERPPELWVVDRSGHVVQKLMVGPNGTTQVPQWTPDNRFMILNTFPSAGRRIALIRVADGNVYDLSEAHWDAFASLSPNGQHLLLWNGRGGFWLGQLKAP